MADNKKYYYMRLNENYFDSETQVLLESMPDGYLYSNILLKLYLKSLKNDGRLMFNDKIPYSPQMIATITRHQIGTVEKALQIFRDLNIIDLIDTGAIYMLDIQNFIGKSNTEADRKRAYRKRIEEEKGQMSLKCPLEIEKELEIEIEKEIDINNSPAKAEPNIPYKEIIEYLNIRLGSNYRHTTNKTKDLIKARFNEGFGLDDFKNVIDKKCVEWINSDMEKYLRPETLFGTKFESYLNQVVQQRKVTTKDIPIDISDF
jgi:predicted phage replisome organizer/uncharacterized phage protein (TIGR02220 family)